MANRASPNFVTAPIFLFCSRIAAHADFFTNQMFSFAIFVFGHLRENVGTGFEEKCRLLVRYGLD